MFTIGVDTREQTPLSFNGYPIRRHGHTFADYYIFEHPYLIAIERKNGDDAVNSAVPQAARDNWIRRWDKAQQRGTEYHIVIERPRSWFEAHHYRSRAHPNAFFGRMASWERRLGHTHERPRVHYCNGRQDAARLVLALLTKAWSLCAQETIRQS